MAEISCLRRIVRKTRRDRFGTDGNTSQEDQQKKTDMVWACGENGRQETTSVAYCLADTI